MDIKRENLEVHGGVLAGLPMDSYYSRCGWYPNGSASPEQVSVENSAVTNGMNPNFIQSPTDSLSHSFSQSPTHDYFFNNYNPNSMVNYSLPHMPMRSNSWDASAYYMLSNSINNGGAMNQSPVAYSLPQVSKDNNQVQVEGNELKEGSVPNQSFQFGPMHSYRVFDDSSMTSIYQPNHEEVYDLEKFNKRRTKSIASELEVVPSNYDRMLPFNMEVHDLAVMLTRPFQCAFPGCGKMFKRSEHLKRHYRSIHTNDRPYTCSFPECNKRFSRTDNLAQHVKIHKPAGSKSKNPSRKNSVSSTGSNQFKFLQLGRPSNSLKNEHSLHLNSLELNFNPNFNFNIGLENQYPPNCTGTNYN